MKKKFKTELLDIIADAFFWFVITLMIVLISLILIGMSALVSWIMATFTGTVIPLVMSMSMIVAVAVITAYIYKWIF